MHKTLLQTRKGPLMYVLLIHRHGTEGISTGVAYATESPTKLREAVFKIFSNIGARGFNSLGTGISIHEIFEDLYLEINPNNLLARLPGNLLYSLIQREKMLEWVEEWKDQETGKFESAPLADVLHPQRLPKDHA